VSGRHGRDGNGRAAGGLRAWFTARLAEVEAERDQLRAELEEARQHIRAQDEVDRILAAGLPPAATGDTGPMPAAQGPRGGGHRAPRDRSHLRLVKLLIPAAFLGRLAVKGSATRKVTGVALAALAAPAAAAGVTHVIQDTPNYAVFRPAPAAVTTSAARHPRPSPATARPRRHHRKPVPVPEPPPPTVSRPSPSPSRSSLPPSAPSPLLTVPAQPVDFGVYMITAITIGNPQDQAVSWSVDCGQDVRPSPASGIMEPGQQGVRVRLSLDPVDGLSAASCVFEPGDEQLAVTWAGAGSPSGGI